VIRPATGHCKRASPIAADLIEAAENDPFLAAADSLTHQQRRALETAESSLDPAVTAWPPCGRVRWPRPVGVRGAATAWRSSSVTWL
jgi:hypothetical protein